MKTTITKFLFSDPAQWIFRLLLGGVFIYASYDKILHTSAFADIIHNYQILPGFLIYISAITMPWLEIFSGICVITGLFKRAGTIILGGLLLLFSVAISFNLARGLDFDCGCFTTVASEGGSDPVGLLIRDILLLMVVAAILLKKEKLKEIKK